MQRWLLSISKSLRSDNRSKQRTVSAAIIVLILAADVITKKLVLGISSPIPVVKGFFDIVHIENSSAAFSLSFFLSKQMLHYLLIVIPSIFILVIGYQLFIASTPHYIAFSLIFAGALGNLLQRAIQGKVTDFLYFHIKQFYWPAFNIADSAITIGAIFLFINLYLTSDKKSKADKKVASDPQRIRDKMS